MNLPWHYELKCFPVNLAYNIIGLEIRTKTWHPFGSETTSVCPKKASPNSFCSYTTHQIHTYYKFFLDFSPCSEIISFHNLTYMPKKYQYICYFKLANNDHQHLACNVVRETKKKLSLTNRVLTHSICDTQAVIMYPSQRLLTTFF